MFKNKNNVSKETSPQILIDNNGSLYSAFQTSDIQRGYCIQGNKLHLFCHYQDNAISLRDRLTKDISLGLFHGLPIRAAVAGLAFLIGVMILLGLSFLQLFHNITGAIALDLTVPEDWLRRGYLLAVLVGASAIIAFAPYLFRSGDGKQVAPGRWLFQQLVNIDVKALREIYYIARKICKRNKVQELWLWNIETLDRNFVAELIRNLNDTGILIKVVTEPENIKSIKDIISQKQESRVSVQHISDLPVNTIPASVKEKRDLIKLLQMLGGPREVTYFAVLMSCSSLKVQEGWQAAFRDNIEHKVGVSSLWLMDFVAQRYGAELNQLALQDLDETAGFAKRAEDRYKIIKRLEGTAMFSLLPVIDWEQHANDLENQVEVILSLLNFSIGGINVRRLDNIEIDAVASLIFGAFHGLSNPVSGNHIVKISIEQSVRSAVYEENYIIGKILHDTIFPDIEGKSQQELNRIVPEQLKGFAPDILFNLSDLLEASGLFKSAIALNHWLENIDPLTCTLRRARLVERCGHYIDAVEIIMPQYKVWLAESENLLTIVKDRSPDVVESIVDYHLQLAWFIINGRLKHESFNPEVAKQALDRAGHIIADIFYSKNLNPLIHWRYYNYLATLAEWNEELTNSLEFHRKAESIPGVPLRWYAGTYVNTGIIYRELARRAFDTPEKALGYIEQAIAEGKKGKDLKFMLNDYDESAISVHNLVLSRLHKFYLDRISNASDADLFEQLQTIEQDLLSGAALLSTRKEGQLIAEALVTMELFKEHQLSTDGLDEVCDLERLKICLELSERQKTGDKQDILNILGIKFDMLTQDMTTDEIVFKLNTALQANDELSQVS